MHKAVKNEGGEDEDDKGSAFDPTRLFCKDPNLTVSLIRKIKKQMLWNGHRIRIKFRDWQYLNHNHSQIDSESPKLLRLHVRFGTVGIIYLQMF